MWELLNTPAYAPFIIAAAILLILLQIEVLGFFFGCFSGILDNMLPDSLIDADFDADMDMGADGDMSLGLKALDWLYVGRIPTMILLVLFLTSFCLVGIAIQQLSLNILGHFLSPWLASLDALVISIPLLKLVAALLYPIMPKDESSAISSQTLIGRPVRIVLGHAAMGSPAQAKLTDEYGQTHYIMVEPDPQFIDTNHFDINTNHVDATTSQLAMTTITADDELVITQKVGERYLVRKLS